MSVIYFDPKGSIQHFLVSEKNYYCSCLVFYSPSTKLKSESPRFFPVCDTVTDTFSSSLTMEWKAIHFLNCVYLMAKEIFGKVISNSQLSCKDKPKRLIQLFPLWSWVEFVQVLRQSMFLENLHISNYDDDNGSFSFPSLIITSFKMPDVSPHSSLWGP